jgi:hypothetical protein
MPIFLVEFEGGITDQEAEQLRNEGLEVSAGRSETGAAQARFEASDLPTAHVRVAALLGSDRSYRWYQEMPSPS